MTQRTVKIGPSVLIVLLGHAFIPLLFILQMFRGYPHDSIAWILSLYIAGGYTLFIYLAGAWSWLGNFSRGSLPVILIIVAVATSPHDFSGVTAVQLLSFESILSLCIGTAFVVLAVQACLGRWLHVPGLDLAFPLRDGTYSIAQGGSRQIVNIHFKNMSQRYGMDILKINRFGFRASGVYPADPNKYSIFGAEVVSPCDGVVGCAQDGFPDFPPPERDPEHRAGNYIALESRGATIYFAHLQQGSVRVRAGDHVHTGQVLGLVGNSGNTTEPHLHIHAEEGGYPGHFSGNPGIPI